MRTRLAMIFVLLVLFLTVIAQNTEVVTIRAFFWTVQMSRIVLLGGAVLFGVLIGILLARPWRKKRAKRKPARPEGGEAGG